MARTTLHPAAVPLGLDELRAVSAYAAACAERVLHHYESAHPSDARPREAIEGARAFAAGGRRVAALRVLAAGAHRAGREAGAPEAREAAMAAGHAAAAAYLHPLAQASQVKHILGSAACAAAAVELASGGGADIGEVELGRAESMATVVVRRVLLRYPTATPGRGRTAQLLGTLDARLRSPVGDHDPDRP